MLIRLIRTTIVPVWFIAFGLLGSLWSPMTGATGMLLLLVGLVAPAAGLILLVLMVERQPVPAVAEVRPHPRSRPRRR
jgi:hypothetical protein